MARDYSRFDALVARMKSANKKIGKERFIPIQSTDTVGKKPMVRIPVYGMYDYQTKSYTVSEPFVDVNTIFNEIEEMLNSAMPFTRAKYRR